MLSPPDSPLPIPLSEIIIHLAAPTLASVKKTRDRTKRAFLLRPGEIIFVLLPQIKRRKVGTGDAVTSKPPAQIGANNFGPLSEEKQKQTPLSRQGSSRAV